MQIGGYEVLAEIARGGQGAVYRVRDPQSGQEAALKVLLDLRDPGELERFLREGQATARLRHPNVVRVHGVGRDEGRPYLVMDLVEGDSLAQRLQRSGPLSEHEAIRIVSEITAAVQAAHSLGILHRDLKPANVLLQGERPLLADFGIAKVADARALTLTGELLGTPGYMAPEQISGDKSRVGPATDVYGLGGILYACLTGGPPFLEASAIATLDKALREDPPPPSRVRPGLNSHLETICLRCLAREERKRYASAADLLDALEACAAPGSVPRRGSRALALALASLIGLIGLLGLVGLLLLQRSSNPTPTPSASSAAKPSPTSGLRAERARKLLTEGKSLVQTDLARAEVCFRQALAADLGLHAARVELSLIYTTRFRLGEAEEFLKGVPNKGHSESDQARLHFAWGRLLFAREQREEGRKRFAKANALERRAAYVAWHAFSKRKANVAQVAVARSLDEREPAIALLLLAATLQKSKPTPSEWAEALAEADTALSYAPENPTLAALTARARFLSGQQEEGLAEARALRERWPQHKSVLIVLGRIYTRLGREEAGQAATAWLEKATAVAQDALRVFPRSRDLRLELGWLFRLRENFPQSYAAYEVLLREFPRDDWTILNAWYTVTTWLHHATRTRDLQGLDDPGPIAERARLLIKEIEASPKLLREVDFGTPSQDAKVAQLWSQLLIARLYAIQRNWNQVDEILAPLEDRSRAPALVLQCRLLCRAERLRSSLVPDPALAARQRRDFQLAKGFEKTAAGIEALWLGASATPPIWFGPGVGAGAPLHYHVEAKRELHDALKAREPESPRVLAAWRAFVELEPNNLLARVALCEALIEARRLDEAIALHAQASLPLQGEPLLIASWARAVCLRGRAEDLPRVLAQLSAVLGEFPDLDLARARRVETYLFLDRPQDAQRDLELLRGKAPHMWFKDYESRVKILLEYGG